MHWLRTPATGSLCHSYVRLNVTCERSSLNKWTVKSVLWFLTLMSYIGGQNGVLFRVPGSSLVKDKSGKMSIWGDITDIRSRLQVVDILDILLLKQLVHQNQIVTNKLVDYYLNTGFYAIKLKL